MECESPLQFEHLFRVCHARPVQQTGHKVRNKGDTMTVTIESPEQALAETSSAGSPFVRYFQLAVLTLAAGALYPLLYLRQNFENTLLQAFHINSDQLGELYSILGIVYVVTYIPSGWLADRVSSRWLV